MSETYDNALTTDAVSSPPRDSKTRNTNKSNKFNTTENIQTDKETNATIPKQQTGTATKTCKIPQSTHNAYANVINISHSTGIQIGSNYVYNMNGSSSEKGTKIAETPNTIKLLANKEHVLKVHISLVSTHVGEGWRNVARLLNYSDGQIDQFYENHNVSGVKEVVYQLLLDWIQNEPEEAILCKLADVLWRSEQKDSVVRLADNIYSP